MTPRGDEVKENEWNSEEDAQFPLQKILIFNSVLSTDFLEKRYKSEIRMSTKRDEYKEDNKEISKQGTQFPSKKIVILDGLSSPDRPMRDFKKG